MLGCRALTFVGFFVITLAWTVTAAVTPTFPFNTCNQNAPSMYSLEPIAQKKGNNTFCFTIRVDPIADCTAYCCGTKADLRKIEFNANSKCKVSGVNITATLNGVPTKSKPTLETIKGAPPGSTLLRLNPLGLNSTSADGAELCITLKPSKAGKGCTSLEDLCVPVPGFPAGSCSAALFDSKLSCCGISAGSVASYTAPPPPPSPEPTTPCQVCVTADMRPSPTTLFPYSIPSDTCQAWLAKVQTDLAEAADSYGSAPLKPTIMSCLPNRMQLCTELPSEDDAADIQSFVDQQTYMWFADAFGFDCKAYLQQYDKTIMVGGSDMRPGCVNAFTAVVCDPPSPESVPFPVPTCTKRPYSTPFVASPFISVLPGRSSNTSLFCFDTTVREPPQGTTPPKCANSTTLLKAEFYMDDAKRGKVKGVGIQPAGAANLTFVSTSWGATGEQTLKVTLNWGKDKAAGGRICVEVDKSLDISSLCVDAQETCRLALFDGTRSCCPVYTASI